MLPWFVHDDSFLYREHFITFNHVRLIFIRSFILRLSCPKTVLRSKKLSLMLENELVVNRPS